MKPSATVGLVGGGQLSRMMIQAGVGMGLRFKVLDPDPACPAGALASATLCAGFDDLEALVRLAEDCDVVSLDIEAPPAKALEQLEAAGVRVLPSSGVLAKIQDKGLQRLHFRSQGLPQPRFQLVETPLRQAVAAFGSPCVLKARRQGYDGRGVRMVEGVDDPVLQGWDGPSLLEQRVELAAELAVMVVRGQDGSCAVYDPVELVMDPRLHLLDRLLAPARVSVPIAQKARALARRAVESLEGVGAFGVELFLDGAGELWLNEVSPRVHNSGHHSIEACACSQFENHLRAVLGWPLGDPRTLRPAATANLLGPEGLSGAYQVHGLSQALALPGTTVHLYDKSETRPGRKLGHLTVTADDVTRAEELAREARRRLSFVEGA